MANAIGMNENGFDEGQESIIIETATATYVYHKVGGGFSSLLDVDGRDWIGYRTGDGPAGEYRGIPNMVYRGSEQGFLHPGHSGTKGSQTEILEVDRDRVSFKSTSDDGKWQVRWDIDNRCARMTVVQIDTEDPHHWLLYEGTPGGEFDTERSLCLRSTGETGPLSQTWERDLPESSWVAFSDPERHRSLYLRCRKQNDCVDMYKPMPPMTVFGFGRRNYGVDSFLVDAGTVLTLGFVDTIDTDAIASAVANVT